MQHNDLYTYISRSYFKATRKISYHLDDLSDMPLAPKLLFILWHIVFLSWLITHLVSKFYLKYFNPNKKTSSIMLVDHLIAGTPAYLTAALTMILQNHSTRICTCIIHYSVIYGKKNWITGHVPYSRGIMIMACFLYAHIVTWSSSIFCAQPWETTHRSEIHACVQQAGIVHKTGKTISLKITYRICTYYHWRCINTTFYCYFQYQVQS